MNNFEIKQDVVKDLIMSFCFLSFVLFARRNNRKQITKRNKKRETF